MRSIRNSKPSVEGAPVVVTARTLKEAYKIVGDEYGKNAVILGTRTVNHRHELGLGHERRIEVTIQMPGTQAPARPTLGRRQTAATATVELPMVPAANDAEINQDIMREVNRIEELVASIADDHARLSKLRLPLCDNPLAQTLIQNGATPEAINTLLTRFITETGAKVEDRTAAVAWLAENLRASNCTWDDFYGCHAFLGETASGRTDLVLTTAALLQKLGRRTLVLNLMPGNNGDIKRLQLEASQNGFDAAVIKKESQLATIEAHLGNYDVVLVDLPHLGHEVMAEGGVIHGWLARNTSFHRHLMVPLDKDPRDMSQLKKASRVWNCDWIAMSRSDMTERPAKMLDLFENIPLPVSLMGTNPAATGELAIAQSEVLLNLMLGTVQDANFTLGVTTADALETTEVAW